MRRGVLLLAIGVGALVAAACIPGGGGGDDAQRRPVRDPVSSRAVLTGRLLAFDETPLVGAFVYLCSSDGECAQSVTDEDGRYEVRAPFGSYILSFTRSENQSDLIGYYQGRSLTSIPAAARLILTTGGSHDLGDTRAGPVAGTLAGAPTSGYQSTLPRGQ